jgi:hypothetical protein
MRHGVFVGPIVVWQKYFDNHLVMSDEFVRIFENFISENDAGDPNDATLLCISAGERL